MKWRAGKFKKIANPEKLLFVFSNNYQSKKQKSALGGSLDEKLDC